jgi:hypothetical protein
VRPRPQDDGQRPSRHRLFAGLRLGGEILRHEHRTSCCFPRSPSIRPSSWRKWTRPSGSTATA